MKAITVSHPVLGESDLDLVDRHRYGDAEAFGELYQRFSSMVYNLAYRFCADREEAADLTQEIFLRVFRHLGKFRGKSSFKTWVYRVAVNHCRSRLARHRPPTRSLTPEPGAVETEIEDPRRSPEEKALAEDDGRVVARALTALSPRFREAVVLRDLEGLTYREISEVLGVRVGTVRSRIARGRDQLLAALETKE